MGSAVNPVCAKETDRRAADAVKQCAKSIRMGAWSADFKSKVSHMSGDDFFGNEKSVTVPEKTTVRIELAGAEGNTTVLKDCLKLQAGEEIDDTYMSVKSLEAFLPIRSPIPRPPGRCSRCT